MSPTLTLANIGVAMPMDDGRQNPGVICMANEERFTAVNFSQPLTTYAIGWQDPENIRETLDAISPPVDVPRRFEFKKAVNAESFLSETDDVRAIGSPFKRVEYKGSSVNEKTYNKGLTIRLDHDENLPGQEESAVARLIKRLDRNDLRRAVALIVAAATNTAKTWDTTAKKDPDMDVITDLITGGDARGIQSNILVYGQTAWSKRLLSLRAQNLAGQANSSTMSKEELQDFFGVDRIVLSKERYQSAAATKTKVLASYLLMYYAQSSIGKDDPSDIKGFWTPTDAGRVKVYREERAKFTDISVEHYSNHVITGNKGIRKFTVS